MHSPTCTKWILGSLLAAALGGQLQPAIAADGFPSRHGVTVSFTMWGPDYGHYVRPGEKVRFEIWITNVCTDLDVVTVKALSLSISNARGTFTTNLLTGPLTLPDFGVGAVVRTRYLVEPGDGDLLHATFRVEVEDTPVSGGPTIHSGGGYGDSIQILPLPTLKIRPVGTEAVRISWPATATTSQLEVSNGIGQPWTRFPRMPSLDHNEYFVMVSTTAAQVQLFQLAPAEFLKEREEGAPNAVNTR